MRTTHSQQRTAGQVMVLGCLALVVSVVMLMASFSLATAVHERIRIQSHADAQAFTLATLEARAFNTTAHYNRAIAAALVADMSLHSWMAIVTADVAMLWSGVAALGAIAAIETAMGCYPYNFSHCFCVFRALRSMFRMMRAARQWGRKARGLEGQFNAGVRGIKEMIDALHKKQVDALSRTKGELTYGLTLNSLKNANAPESRYELGVNSLTTQGFVCALEGTDMDNDCNQSGRAKASLAQRSTIIQNTANASRNLFDLAGPMSSLVSHQNFNGPSRADVPQNALTDGTWMHYFITMSRVGQGSSPMSNSNHGARNVGAFAMGVATIMGFRHVPVMAMPIYADIISGQNQRHMGAPGLHQGSHREFDQQMATEPCTDRNCFVNFRADPDADNDFGQPSTYGAVSQSLRVYQTGESSFKEDAPWEINKDGEVKLELVRGQEARMNIVPRGRGYAVAKGKTYFHQLGNWRVAPNFFDPFWRAKLHFFKADELRDVVTRSGDTKGIALITGRAPVEGEPQ